MHESLSSLITIQRISHERATAEFKLSSSAPFEDAESNEAETHCNADHDSGRLEPQRYNLGRVAGQAIV